jgi:hypothetical protein
MLWIPVAGRSTRNRDLKFLHRALPKFNCQEAILKIP